MGDPRLRSYADLLVGTCLDVRPGWQVVVNVSQLAALLLREGGRIELDGGIVQRDGTWI